MGSNSSFYYRILNIGSSDIDVVDIINKVISDFMIENGISYDSVGLCNVVSTVLGEKFKEFGVESIVLNTKDLFDLYEHEAILVRGISDDELNYYLVDLTFRQFLNQGGTLRECFVEWPADKLMGLGNDESIFSNELLEQGYGVVNSKLLSSYFSCFKNSQGKIVVDDIDKFFIDSRINKL